MSNPKYLGNKITNEQLKEIIKWAQTGEDIEIGEDDYWIIGGMKYTVCWGLTYDFEHYYNAPPKTPHYLMLPFNCEYQGRIPEVQGHYAKSQYHNAYDWRQDKRWMRYALMEVNHGRR